MLVCSGKKVLPDRNKRTPQLMSKPTPPGDTMAAGSSMSNAATFPTANPYPLWMSGMPMEDPTIPAG